jgi:hypothetical protein
MKPILAALLRTDLRYFVRKVFTTVCPGERYMDNWHIDAIVHRLMLVYSGRNRRLLINQPPRSLKSICVSIAYVAWLLGKDPSRRIIVVSYSQDFAAELHRQFRVVVGSDWYQGLFPATIWSKETGFDLVTTMGSGSLVSRLNNKETGAIVVVMQRLHEDDLAGHLLRMGSWDHLMLPAIALEEHEIPLCHGKVQIRRPGDLLHPERENAETVERIRAEIGSLQFSAQYQQQPVPVEGNLILRAWFRVYDRLPEPGPGQPGRSDYRGQAVQRRRLLEARFTILLRSLKLPPFPNGVSHPSGTPHNLLAFSELILAVRKVLQKRSRKDQARQR